MGGGLSGNGAGLADLTGDALVRAGGRVEELEDEIADAGPGALHGMSPRRRASAVNESSPAPRPRR